MNAEGKGINSKAFFKVFPNWLAIVKHAVVVDDLVQLFFKVNKSSLRELQGMAHQLAYK